MVSGGQKSRHSSAESLAQGPLQCCTQGVGLGCTHTEAHLGTSLPKLTHLPVGQRLSSLPRGPLCWAPPSMAACTPRAKMPRESTQGRDGSHSDPASHVPAQHLSRILFLRSESRGSAQGCENLEAGILGAISRGCLPQVPTAVKEEAF